MNIFRKVVLGLSVAAFLVCSLFLELFGGIGILFFSDNERYAPCGVCLIVSAALFLISLVAAFFRKTAANAVSLVFNAAATCCYIYTISVFRGIPNEAVPAESVEILINRIYPSVAVTVLLCLAVFADFFSYDRMTERAEKRNKKLAERTRSLNEEEKII